MCCLFCFVVLSSGFALPLGLALVNGGFGFLYSSCEVSIFGFLLGDLGVGTGSGNITLGSDLVVVRGTLFGMFSGRRGDGGVRDLSLSCPWAAPLVFLLLLVVVGWGEG